jgi:hypothetical protein
VRFAALAVLSDILEHKCAVSAGDEQFRAILNAIARGLRSDFATARRALLVFVCFCERFSAAEEFSFLGDFFGEIIDALMAAFGGLLDVLPFTIRADREAAVAIAEAALNPFAEIVRLTTETDFLVACTRRQLWSERMLTQKSVQYFLKPVNHLSRTVGQKLDVEMRRADIRDFLRHVSEPGSPFPELADFAVDVRQFYEYL